MSGPGPGVGWGGGGGGSSSGADTALSNLASVAINTSLISDTDSTDDLGSSAIHWANLYADTGVFSGASDTIGSSINAANGVRLGSAKVVNWSSTTSFDGAADVGLARSAAAMLAITNGSTASFILNCAAGTDYLYFRNSVASNRIAFRIGNTTNTHVTLGGSGAYRFTGNAEADVGPDALFYRVGAGIIGTGGSSLTAAGGFQPAQSANGATMQILTTSEAITLNTGGTTTDSSANLLPANSLILAVVARITTDITVATDWKLGDPTTAGRFTAANSTLAAGTTDYGYVHLTTGIASATTGMIQTAAAKVRITTTGTPSAGVVRVTVFYCPFVAPTS